MIADFTTYDNPQLVSAAALSCAQRFLGQNVPAEVFTQVLEDSGITMAQVDDNSRPLQPEVAEAMTFYLKSRDVDVDGGVAKKHRV